MAMPRWAFLIGSTSLTPSPIMATWRPCFFRASTICTFCAGETRPNDAARADQLGRVRPPLAAPSPETTGVSASALTAAAFVPSASGTIVARTVSALSPERILKQMPWRANSSKTRRASGRSSSLSATRASGRRTKPSSDPANSRAGAIDRLGEQQHAQAPTTTGRQEPFCPNRFLTTVVAMPRTPRGPGRALPVPRARGRHCSDFAT